MSLPVLFDEKTGGLAVVDPDTGAVQPVRDASDRALAHAARLIAEADAELLEMRRTVALELRERHGVGQSDAGGYEFVVTEAQSWPMGATVHALSTLLARGAITQGDYDRCLPVKPKPDARQLKALAARLALKDAAAHNTLAAALTTSPPNVRDVHATATDETPA